MAITKSAKKLQEYLLVSGPQLLPVFYAAGHFPHEVELFQQVHERCDVFIDRSSGQITLKNTESAVFGAAISSGSASVVSIVDRVQNALSSSTIKYPFLQERSEEDLQRILIDYVCKAEGFHIQGDSVYLASTNKKKSRLTPHSCSFSTLNIFTDVIVSALANALRKEPSGITSLNSLLLNVKKKAPAESAAMNLATVHDLKSFIEEHIQTSVKFEADNESVCVRLLRNEQWDSLCVQVVDELKENMIRLVELTRYSPFPNEKPRNCNNQHKIQATTKQVKERTNLAQRGHRQIQRLNNSPKKTQISIAQSPTKQQSSKLEEKKTYRLAKPHEPAKCSGNSNKEASKAKKFRRYYLPKKAAKVQSKLPPAQVVMDVQGSANIKVAKTETKPFGRIPSSTKNNSEVKTPNHQVSQSGTKSVTKAEYFKNERKNGENLQNDINSPSKKKRKPKKKKKKNPVTTSPAEKEFNQEASSDQLLTKMWQAKPTASGEPRSGWKVVSSTNSPVQGISAFTTSGSAYGFPNFVEPARSINQSFISPVCTRMLPTMLPQHNFSVAPTSRFIRASRPAFTPPQSTYCPNSIQPIQYTMYNDEFPLLLPCIPLKPPKPIDRVIGENYFPATFQPFLPTQHSPAAHVMQVGVGCLPRLTDNNKPEQVVLNTLPKKSKFKPNSNLKVTTIASILEDKDNIHINILFLRCQMQQNILFRGIKDLQDQINLAKDLFCLRECWVSAVAKVKNSSHD